MLTVLIFSHTSELGGAEIALLRFLKKVTGFKPIVSLPKGALKTALENNNIVTEELFNLSPLLRRNSFSWFFLFLKQWFLSFKEIKQIIKKHSPHIVQSNNLYTQLYTFLPSYFLKQKMVLHLHDYLDSVEKKIIFKICSPFLSSIIFVSDHQKKSIGKSKESWIRRYNEVSLEDIETKLDKHLLEIIDGFKRDGKKRIGLASSFDPRKGILEIIQAIKLVEQQNTSFVLLIAGNHKDQKYQKQSIKIKEYLNKNKVLKEKVIFLGHIQDIKTFYSNLDIFIHFPVQADPLPNVLLEARLLCPKIIFSNNGGNPECVINENSCTSVPAKDLVLLSKVILKELGQTNDLQAMQA